MGVCFSNPMIKSSPGQQKLITQSQISRVMKLTSTF